MGSLPRTVERSVDQIRSRIIERAIEYSHSEGRNNACFGMGMQFRDNDFSQAEAESAAEAYAASVGLSRAEALACVRSAYRRPAREAWGEGFFRNSFRPQKPNTKARFRGEEFKRLLAAASDAAQRERIARARGLELIKAFDFNHPDWKTIDACCLDDQEADRLVAVATWLERAPEAELVEYRQGVGR